MQSTLIQSDLIQSSFTTFKDTSPLVHNMTNDVANNTVANILLAAGASPAMVYDIKEAPEFVKLSHALSLNVGTLTQCTLQSMLATADVAHHNNIPWVLDPVAVGATVFRQNACKQLLKFKPDVIRGNASEILALAGMESRSKGTDSADSVKVAIKAAQQLTKYAKVVVVTGAIDFVTVRNGVVKDNSEQEVHRGWFIEHGHPLMTQVTAIGCSLTALIAGFIGARPLSNVDKNLDSLIVATLAALCYYGKAGEIAAADSKGPGSFYVNFLDALYSLNVDSLVNSMRITAYDNG